MRPQVIDESRIFAFKFWFEGNIYCGMYYQNELFCQLGCFHIRDRPQVYQAGSKLAQQGAVITITCAPTTCSLWGSLRADSVKQLLLNPTALQIPRLPSSSFTAEPP